MLSSPLKDAVAYGKPLFGTFLSMRGFTSAEIACQSGADWLFLDLEHGGSDESSVRSILLAGERYGVPVAVRVETPDRIRIGRVLDAGAEAIVLPRVESVDEAALALSALTYPPTGIRGTASYNQSRRFGFPLVSVEEANQRVTGIVQIETLGALEHVDAIAALPGADVLFVGPADLSAALGAPGDLDSVAYTKALRLVVSAASANGIAAGILVSDSVEARQRAQEGFTLIAIASDALLLSRGFRTLFDVARADSADLST